MRARLLALAITVGLVASVGMVAALPSAGRAAVPRPSPSFTPPSPDGPTTSPASTPGLTAGCQVGIDTGGSNGTGYQPVTTANYSDTPAYQVKVTNNTSSQMTVSGFGTAFYAFGNNIWSDQPTVTSALIEPGENWTFTIDTGYGSDSPPQVSENTYLNETCTVEQVVTDGGDLTPVQVSEPNGVANSHALDVQNAQQALSSDTSTLSSDAASLEGDTSLAGDVNQMNKDLKQEQQDWLAEQQVPTACADSGNSGTIAGDAGTVAGDASTVSGDQSTLNGDVTYLQGNNRIAGVQNDLTQVQGDLATIRSLGAAPATDVSSAIAAGNKAVTDSNNAISWANGQSDSIVAAANQLSSQANAYSNAHQC